MAALEQELRRIVSAYVAAQLAFDDFALVFAEMTWDISHEDDAEARRIAYGADLVVAEYTSGHRTEKNLRWALAELLGERLEVELIEAPTLFRPHRVRARASNALLREAVNG